MWTTHLEPRDFFGIAFWLGFVIHSIGAEAWIDCTRPFRPGATGARAAKAIPSPER